MSIRQAGVIGLGLVGGSVGAALRRQGVMVHGFDSKRPHLDIARQRGLIDVAAGSMAQAVAAADLVVLAVPASAIIKLLPLADGMAPPGALLIDTGSVKGPVVEVMSGLSGADRAIGGHPIAGKEQAGPEAADGDLFSDHPFVLTPTAATAAATVARAEQLVRLLGARPVILTAAEHDEILARTSHLPQLLSSTLALAVSATDLVLSGPGLRDMTRLAGSEVTMWRDILLANRGQVTQAARQYIERLDELIRVVEVGDGPRLERALETGRRAVEPLRGGGS